MVAPQATPSFWSELRRRRVVRVAVGYAVPAFVVIEVADVMVPALALPSWVVTVVAVLCIVGFPVSLILAWMFDITPSGVVRTGPSEAVEAESPPDREPPVYDRQAIVVLPFDNLSDDPENEFFSDGVMEDILTHLSRCRDLHVISRTSAMSYKKTSKSIAEIARELKVGSVLEGSVRKSGGRVRVVAQLIDCATDRHLWADNYDRVLEDIFAVQSDVAERIAEALEAELAPGQVERMRRGPTDDMVAYELFLRGRQDVYRTGGSDILRGIEQLKAAIERDPAFAPAYAMLALAYLAAPYWVGIRSGDSLPLARDAAQQALELDDSLALAWVARAGVKVHYDWDWTGAAEDFERAGELDTNLPDLYLWKGMYLLLLERFDDAAVALRSGTSLDPHSQIMVAFLGFARHFGGHRAEGERILRGALKRDPRFDVVNLLAWCLMEEDRYDEAADLFGMAAEMSGGHPYLVTSRAMALHAGGHAEEASELVASVRANAPEAFVTHELLAYMALVDGKPDQAVEELWAAADERSITGLWFRAVTVFRRVVEGHPRWQALMHRIWPDDFPEEASAGIG